MRSEFPAKIKVAAFDRCKGHCEKCGAHLYVGKYAFDHVLPDALGGKPTLDNCEVLCDACHSEKTFSKGGDVPRIAKMKRQRAKHIGARKPSGFGWSRKYRKKINGRVELR